MSREIMKRYSIGAKKSLGQNFLVDEIKVQEIADVLDISEKNIIEVGPWYGALTQKLASKKPKSLYLVELDRDMISILEERKVLWEIPTSEIDFQIFYQDVLEFIPAFWEKNYSVIANIPYYITSPILRHFLYDIPNLPESMLLLMQKDVADKILWWKKKKSSVLSLFVEKKCHVTHKIFVPKESFLPVPKVESSVLLFEIHEKYRDIDDDSFLELIKKWFSEPRKKCIKNLVKWGYDFIKISRFLYENNFDENTRAEDMSIDVWCQLCEIL